MAKELKQLALADAKAQEDATCVLAIHKSAGPTPELANCVLETVMVVWLFVNASGLFVRTGLVRNRRRQARRAQLLQAVSSTDSAEVRQAVWADGPFHSHLT